MRRAFKVGVGDGGRRGAAEGASARTAITPRTCRSCWILLGLIELAGGDRRILWAAGIAFILARIAHAIGMDRPSPSRLRMIGMGGNVLVLVGLAGWALSFAYRLPAPPAHPVQIGPGRTAQIT